MPKIQIWAELSDERLHDYELEARRQGVEVEKLVEQTVNVLLHEMEEEQNEGLDVPATIT